jgi:two-component system, OmpR family, sensor histidine kinase KdpD
LRSATRGGGLDADDRALLGQKFLRGNRHAQVTSGLGLGFWIASAFVAANDGTVDATSEGTNKGMTVTIRLPLAMNDRLPMPTEDVGLEAAPLDN